MKVFKPFPRDIRAAALNRTTQQHQLLKPSKTDECRKIYQNGEPSSVMDVKDEPVTNSNDMPTSEYISAGQRPICQSDDDVMHIKIETNSVKEEEDADTSSDSLSGYESLDELYVTFKDASSSEDEPEEKKKKTTRYVDEEYQPSEYEDSDDSGGRGDDKDGRGGDKDSGGGGGDDNDSGNDATCSVQIHTSSGGVFKDSFNADEGNEEKTPEVEKLSDNEYACTCCPQICSNVADANDHILSHYEFHCDVCGKKYLSVRQLKFHRRKCHRPNNFICLFSGCDYTAPTKTTVFKHIQAVHSKEKLFICAWCRCTSKTATQFSRHIKTIHYVSPNSTHACVLCDSCGASFRCQAELREHMHSVHGILSTNEQLAVCDVCGELCRNKHLRKHKIRKHVDKTIPCRFDDCNALFKTQYFMETHYKTVHLGIKRLKCPYEGCTFGCHSKQTVNAHINMVHLNIRNIPCTWPGCGKTFYQKKHLLVHMRIHCDEKPLSCELCDYTCRQRTALNWHMKKKHCMEVAERNYNGGSPKRLGVASEDNTTPIGIPAVSHAKKPGRKGKKIKSELY